MEAITENANFTEDTTDPELFYYFDVPFVFPKGFHITAHILYNLVMIFGLVGNSCVLLIFSVKKVQLKKLPTPLLANLALSDLLITLFCLETGYLSILWQYWPFGKVLCYAISPVKSISVFVSCYTLIALSVSRYLKIKNPLKVGIMSRNYGWTIGIIWILAICTSLPVGIFTSYEINIVTGLPRCGEYAWESEMKEIIYDAVLITLQYIAPVIVLIFTYSKISILVLKNKTMRQKMSNGTFHRHKNLRTIRMSVMIVLGYTIAWLPYNVVALLAKYHRPIGDSNHFPYIFVMCHWLAMSHAVYNPIIYIWLNESFRLYVLGVFCNKTVRRRTLKMQESWRLSTYTGRDSAFPRRSTIVLSGRSFSESTTHQLQQQLLLTDISTPTSNGSTRNTSISTPEKDKETVFGENN